MQIPSQISDLDAGVSIGELLRTEDARAERARSIEKAAQWQKEIYVLEYLETVEEQNSIWTTSIAQLHRANH